MKNEPRVPRYSTSKRMPFPKSPGKRPLAFMFQPTHYKVVSTPTQLKLWEKSMRDDVGARADSPTLKSAKGKASLTLSYSVWRDSSDLTDCDEV